MDQQNLSESDISSKTRQLYAVIDVLRKGESDKYVIEQSLLNIAKQYLEYENINSKELENNELFLVEVYTSILRRVVPYKLLWDLGFDTHASYKRTYYRFKPSKEEIEYFLGLNKDLEYLASVSHSAYLVDDALTAFNKTVVNGRTVSDYFMSFRYGVDYQTEYVEDTSMYIEELNEENSVTNNMRLLYTYVFKGTDLIE
jgi:hypothetical protein